MESTARPPFEAEQLSKVILFVDDDQAMRAFGRMILEPAGYTVRDAANGDEALKIIKDQARSVDLLITDIVMPGVNGGEVAAAARSLCPSTQILYISGFDYAMMELSPDVPGYYLQKPLSRETLLSKVREILAPGAYAAQAGGVFAVP